MRGLRTAAMATRIAVAAAAAGLGCGSLLMLDPVDGSSSPNGQDANGAPAPEPDDGSFSADADASIAADARDASDGDSAHQPIVMGSLSCGPASSETGQEAACLAAVGECHHLLNMLPDGGEPCVKTDASAAGESYCTGCVAIGLGGQWIHEFRQCDCH